MNAEPTYVRSFTDEPEPGKSRLHGFDRPQYRFDTTSTPMSVVKACRAGLGSFLDDFDYRQIDWMGEVR